MWPAPHRLPPGPQAGLPGGAEAPVRPAVGVFAAARPDLATISLPEPPVGQEAVASPAPPRLDRWAAYQPAGLALLWAVAAFIDLAGRREMRANVRGSWALVVAIVPWAGPLAYLLASRPRLGKGARLALVGGGLALYLLIVLTAAVRTAA